MNLGDSKVLQFMQKLNHRCPSWITLMFSAPLIYLVMLFGKDPWMSIITGKLPMYILTGKIFTEKFEIIHAGFSLDQPTIGKWLFWFSVLTCIAIPLILTLRWLVKRNNLAEKLFFAIPVLIICLSLTAILIWPTFMLIQYIVSMGITVKRMLGLLLCAFFWYLLPYFMIWVVRQSRPFPHYRIAIFLATVLGVPSYLFIRFLTWSFSNWPKVIESSPTELIIISVALLTFIGGWSLCFFVLLPIKRIFFESFEFFRSYFTRKDLL